MTSKTRDVALRRLLSLCTGCNARRLTGTNVHVSFTNSPLVDEAPASAARDRWCCGRNHEEDF